MRILSLLLLLGFPASASTLNFSVFSTAYTNGSYGFGYDPSTQTYYVHEGYGGISAPLDVYNSLAAFASNTPTSTVTLADTVGGCTYYPTTCDVPDGTYFTVENGELIARPNDNSAELAEWNISSGALTSTASYSQFNGTNGNGTFDWGGFSGMNVLQDQTGTYLLSVGSNGDWDISTLGSNLAVSNTHDTGLTQLGYAFLVDGTLFANDGTTHNAIQYSINPLTGVATNVSIATNLPNTPGYVTSAFYNSNLDEVFLYSNATNTVYSLSNASSALGVSPPTPEPASLALLLAPLAALVAFRRRLVRQP